MRAPFNVGDKVVCINARNLFGPERFTALPEEGRVYCVRDLYIDKEGHCACRLVGIRGQMADNTGYEPGFMASRFVEINRYRARRQQKRKATSPSEPPKATPAARSPS